MANRFNFRVWDKQMGIIVDFDEADVHDENNILMQSTGLVDKNGTEIFEGDIITRDTTDFEASYTIVWFPGEHQTGWKKLPVGNERAFTDVGPENCSRYIVTGNIYENPGEE